MCGIVGTINWGTPETLQRMVGAIAHRGPDDQGEWIGSLPDGGWVGLGSRRLSILDLSHAGHMPMSSSDGRFVIVYNGEIYNYRFLQSNLEKKGYHFRSNSDTEVILYLFQEYGKDCVHHLNGMFSIAIWDECKKSLFLARDHFGIKPLYYSHQKDKFIFSSEVKSILQISEIQRKVNMEALNQYLTFLWVPEPLTLYENIYKLPAGHHAIFHNGALKITQYWDLELPPADHHFKASKIKLSLELHQRLVTTVHAQMISDVPVGAFLSSGLDSSSIVAAMAASGSNTLKTFTITFPSQYRTGELTLDDPQVARRTAKHFACEHREIIVEPDVINLLPKLIGHMDEPIADPAIISAYLVCEAARTDVSVLLSGVGGDEIFAGYRKYVAHYLAQHYQRLPQFVRHYLIEPGMEVLPSFRGSPLKGYIRLIKKMARSGSLPSQDRFISAGVYISDNKKETLYNTNLHVEMRTFDPRVRHYERFARVSHADFLNQMLYLDTKIFMPSLNLLYNDKMSMASSIEVRVPFLDRELVEWAMWNVPPALKLCGYTTKFLLREAMSSTLPKEVLKQRKAGFGAPVDYWLANDLREMADDLLTEDRIQKRGYFNPKTVRHMIEAQRHGQQDWSMQIWQLLTFEIWLQTFIDKP